MSTLEVTDIRTEMRANAVAMVQIVTHPLAQDALRKLRKVETLPACFRQYLAIINMILFIEATKDLETTEVPITTPLCDTTAMKLCNDCVIQVAILRAALTLVNTDFLPKSPVGMIHISRDEETAKPQLHSVKLPHKMRGREVILFDPMLATGGSAVMAIDQLRKRHVGRIKFVCVVAAPEGILFLKEKYPDVEILTLAVDSHLDERKYIVPGLGDFGDRAMGTDDYGDE